ncbi:MAG: shikimate kinase [Victivallales bacterium]|nr:shikimate kinase [Victivallales bacterium]
MNVVFIGMKHCGKSTHGRRLATALGWDFLDTDEVLQDIYCQRHRTRLGVREIFLQVGEDGFRRLEEEVMDVLLALDGDRVVAMGGRMPVNEEIQQRIHALGLVVYLQLPAAVLFERVRRGGIPPFLDPERPRESFDVLYRRREPYYCRCADLIIALDDLPAAQAATIIESRIREAMDHAR